MFQIKLELLVVLAGLFIANTFAKQSVEIEPRIILGEDAVRAQFPYFVVLEIETTFLSFEISKICGASLISNEWVLTGGLCVSKLSKDDKIWLHLGSLKFNDEDEIGRKLIVVSGDNVHVHPKYSSLLGVMNPKNDIALIKLPSLIPFTEYIKPVPLACTSTKGTHAIAMGNGIASIHGHSSILKYIQLQITQQNDETICSNKLQLKTIAPGDFGGPLVAADTGALIGITSHAGLFHQCFTRVAAYLDWIKSTTGIATCV